MPFRIQNNLRKRGLVISLVALGDKGVGKTTSFERCMRIDERLDDIVSTPADNDTMFKRTTQPTTNPLTGEQVNHEGSDRRTRNLSTIYIDTAGQTSIKDDMRFNGPGVISAETTMFYINATDKDSAEKLIEHWVNPLEAILQSGEEASDCWPVIGINITHLNAPGSLLNKEEISSGIYDSLDNLGITKILRTLRGVFKNSDIYLFLTDQEPLNPEKTKNYILELRADGSYGELRELHKTGAINQLALATALKKYGRFLDGFKQDDLDTVNELRKYAWTR